jgi:hypothetical protein
MAAASRARRIGQWIGVGIGASAAAAYATHAALAWSRYGRPQQSKPEEDDPLLDRFMPIYEIAERHHTDIPAPAAVTLAAARELELLNMPIARALFAARERLLGAAPSHRSGPRGLLADAAAMGWVVLDEIPDREIVVGAVTRPWEAKVTFRSIAPEEFAAFNEPDYVKIVWTLRADRVSDTMSIFRTETRAVATDQVARAKFRRYWSLLSPGIILIRWSALGPLKAAVRRRGWTGRQTRSGETIFEVVGGREASAR